MEKRAILVVDDEKNIRFTVSHALGQMNIPVATASNGEEALQKLSSGQFGLVFLDLKMPGMDGMEVLRMVKHNWPDIEVIIITAHGSISSAVEAMKLGAVDFIQKPFTPQEIREMAVRSLERESFDEVLDEYFLANYPELIAIARRHINNNSFQEARYVLSKAIAKNPENPEAYNLFGAMLEIKREPLEAQKFYRAALDIDPTYKPAWANIERITSFDRRGDIDMGLQDKNNFRPSG